MKMEFNKRLLYIKTDLVIHIVDCSLLVQLECKELNLSTKTLFNNRIKFGSILHIARHKLNIVKTTYIYITKFLIFTHYKLLTL